MTSSNPSNINVISNLSNNPLAFEYRDGFLYFGYGNKVAKINPNESNPIPEMVVENLDSNIYSLIFYEDTLLIGMSLAYKISKVNFNQEPLIVEDFIDTNAGQPASFAIWNDDLYIARGIGGNIFKIENFNTVLNIEDQKPFIAIGVYPNPSLDKIKVLGIDGRYTFEIFDLNGKLVSKGQKDVIYDINISDLSSGLYHIKLSNNASREYISKFIKR